MKTISVKSSVSILLVISGLSFFLVPSALAGPQSTTYELKEWTFGAGGAAADTSSTYSLLGTFGEVEFGRLTSTTYATGNGLSYIIMANTPGTTTVTNPSSYYDRLKFVLDTQNNPTDTLYALQISTDSTFATNINYIKNDLSLGTTLSSSDYKTYTNWGGASGGVVTNLAPGTTYYIRAKAQQGTYTESGWGTAGSAATVNPSLTFGLSANTVTFSSLNAGNSYTDNAKTTVITTTTNAYNGYTVYARETAALTDNAAHTIADYGSTNAVPSTWAGNGFGYTTSDNALGGTGGTTRFSAGTKYAGFGTTGPGDPVADDTAPVAAQPYTVTYRITTSNTQAPGTYTNTLLYTIVPTY